MTEVRLARSPPTSGDRRRLHHRAVYMASAQAALGDTEEALAFLREGVRDRDRRVMTSLRTDPVWDVMRSDPGFVSLMREIRNQLSGRGGRGEQREEAEGETGEGVPRTSRHPRRPPAVLLQELSGELFEGSFFVSFQRVSSLCTSLRGDALRRILEVRTTDPFCSGNERITGTFRDSTTRLSEVFAQTDPHPPKDSTNALFEAN